MFSVASADAVVRRDALSLQRRKVTSPHSLDLKRDRPYSGAEFPSPVSRRPSPYSASLSFASSSSSSSSYPPCSGLPGREENLHDFFVQRLSSDTPAGSVGVVAPGDCGDRPDREDDNLEGEPVVLLSIGGRGGDRRDSNQEEASLKRQKTPQRDRKRISTNGSDPRGNVDDIGQSGEDDVTRSRGGLDLAETTGQQVGSKKPQGGVSTNAHAESEGGGGDGGDIGNDGGLFVLLSSRSSSRHPMYVFARGRKVLSLSGLPFLRGESLALKKYLSPSSFVSRRRSLESRQGTASSSRAARQKGEDRLSRLSFQTKRSPYGTSSTRGKRTLSASGSRREEDSVSNSAHFRSTGMPASPLSAAFLRGDGDHVEALKPPPGKALNTPSSSPRFPDARLPRRSRETVLKCFNIPLSLSSPSSLEPSPNRRLIHVQPTTRPPPPVESSASSRSDPVLRNAVPLFFFSPSLQGVASFSSTVLPRKVLPSTFPVSERASALSSLQARGIEAFIGGSEQDGPEEERGEQHTAPEGHLDGRTVGGADKKETSHGQDVAGTILEPAGSLREEREQRQPIPRGEREKEKQKEENEEGKRRERGEKRGSLPSVGTVQDTERGRRVFRGIMRQVVGVATDFDGTLTDYYRTIERKEKKEEGGRKAEGAGDEEEEEPQLRRFVERAKTTEGIKEEGEKGGQNSEEDTTSARNETIAIAAGKEEDASVEGEILKKKKRSGRDGHVYSVEKDVSSGNKTAEAIKKKGEEAVGDAEARLVEREFVDSTTSLLSMARKKSTDPHFFDGVADLAVQVYNRGRQEVLEPFERDVYSFFAFLNHHCSAEEVEEEAEAGEKSGREVHQGGPGEEFPRTNDEVYRSQKKKEGGEEREERRGLEGGEPSGEILVGEEWLAHFVEVVDRYEEKMVNTENTRILLQGIMKGKSQTGVSQERSETRRGKEISAEEKQRPAVLYVEGTVG